MKKEIVTIKYPLRYLEQIILIVLIVYFGINFKMTFSNSTYSLIFVTLCATWLFSIIYMLRNKTYYYVDKADYKYLIRKKDLNSKEEKDDSERFIADHIRYDDKDIDILNGIDLLFSLPNNKIINKRIKNKVLNYSKYQIDSIQNITNFIGIKIYKIIFKNNTINDKYLLSNNFNIKTILIIAVNINPFLIVI